MSSFTQWNETIKLFRGGMPLRRHWAHFRCYDWSFTGSEAVDYLHELLRHNNNFGPEVNRYQTLQLLRKFLKAHVIEDIKGRHGTENFEDNGQLFRHVLPLFTHRQMAYYLKYICCIILGKMLTFTKKRLMSNLCLNNLLCLNDLL